MSNIKMCNKCFAISEKEARCCAYCNSSDFEKIDCGLSKEEIIKRVIMDFIYENTHSSWCVSNGYTDSDASVNDDCKCMDRSYFNKAECIKRAKKVINKYYGGED